MTRSLALDPLAAVPREWFIPDIVWRHERGRSGNDLVPVDRRRDPDAWARLVEADEPIITQVDDGHPAPDGTGYTPTSSCSDRLVVAEMLQLLAPAPGERVLEIGTGTGWNAALLAALGAKVTTVEIDPQLAEQARQRLAAHGYSDVEVVCADGAAIDLPVDRLIATVGVVEIPRRWVANVRPGGRIVAPLTNSWEPPGIAVLTRTPNGAIGRLAGPADFMPLRGGHERPRPLDLDAEPEHSSSELHPWHLAGNRDAAVAIGQRVTGIRRVWHTDTLWLYAQDSWASLTVTDDGPPYPVAQAGPRRLLDEVADAYRWWQAQGEPTVADWTITITHGEGQRIHL